MAEEIPDHRKCYTQKTIAAAKIINELNIPVDAILPTLLEGPKKGNQKKRIRKKRSEVECFSQDQILKTICCSIVML